MEGSTVTFSWSAGAGATELGLTIGTTGVGSNDVNGGSQGTNLSGTVSGLPTNGSPVYVRLWTLVGGATWQFNDYTYTAATQRDRKSAVQGKSVEVGGRRLTVRGRVGAGGSGYRVTFGAT